jgi:glycosyltransferase involved in cell wall biosynthesis
MVVITHALRLILQKEYEINLPESDFIIAPNGVDWDRFATQPESIEARRILGLPDRLTVGFSGHFYPGRGTQMLYDLARVFPEIQFLWIGGRKEDIDYWKNKSALEGVNNILLTGFIDNSRLPGYLAAADVLLIPFDRVVTGSSGGNSADICSPMKMFEYMATGRAIVTSELPVIREVLNEKNAVFCPPEDLPAWQSTFANLFKSPSRIKALGTQARQDASLYTWQTRAKKALLHFLE